MSCGWEGNRRSGVALSMRHRLQWFIHLWAQGLSREDEHLTDTLTLLVCVWYGALYVLLYDTDRKLHAGHAGSRTQ